MEGPTIQETQLSTPAEIRERYAALQQETSHATLDTAKEALSRASQSSGSVKEMLDAAAIIPGIKFLLAQDCRIPENYTIAEHESNWLAAFERYVAGGKLPLPIEDSAIRLMGVFHDIGKPLPDKKSDQGVYTLGVIKDIKDALPIDSDALRIIASVIGNDPIGKFIVSNFEQQATPEQRKALAATAQTRLLTIEDLQSFARLVALREPDEGNRAKAAEIAAEINLRAKALNIPAIELFNLHLVSYLVDVGAYTYDAVSYNAKRAKPGIEFVFALNPNFKVGVDNDLFLRDPQRGIMRLSPSVGALVGLIERELVEK
jgi:hypothetical protein